MKLLYDDPYGIIINDGIPESKGESTGESKSEGESEEENTTESQKKGKSNVERVFSLLRSNGELTLPEIAKNLNLSLSGIEKIVRQLKGAGRLVREGSTKAGRWIVKE